MGDLVPEVEASLEAASDDDSRYPQVYEHGGNVAATRGFDPDDLEGVRTPRVVRTSFNDTSDAGSGTLHERLGDHFVEIDFVSSPMPDYGAYVPDYFRINYGIAARYDYDRLESPGPTERVTAEEDWPTILATDWEQVPVAPDTLREWFEAVGEGGSSDESRVADPERVAELLDHDGLYRPVASLLAHLDGHDAMAALAESAGEDLRDDDRAVRDRAVRRLAAIEVDDRGRYRRLLETLPTVSRRTRALVAADLWYPTPVAETDADGTLVSALLSLTDDPVPELRIGAFMGASRAIGALYDRASTTAPDLETELATLAKPYFEAYAELLRDEDPRIRERTTRMRDERLGRVGVTPFVDGLWLRPGFPLRWRVVRGLEDNVADDDLGTPQFPRPVIPEAFDGEPSAVPTLVEYAYRERGPEYRAVRAALAKFARTNPTAAVEALDPVIAAVEDGDVVAADLRLLYALADDRPNRVGTVADELRALLSRDPDAGGTTDRDRFLDRLAERDPEEMRREAARTLNTLPTEAHSVDQTRLESVLEGVTEQRYGTTRLVPSRMAALAEADPGAAVDRLRGLPRRIDSEEVEVRRSSVESAIVATARVAPGVVAEALPEVVTLLDSPADVSTDLAIALARTARARPERVAEHAAKIGTLVGHYERETREAAASALVAVGRADEGTLPAPFGALVARPGDAAAVETIEEVTDRDHRSVETPDDWPIGVVARDDPARAADVVVDCLATDCIRQAGSERLVQLSDVLAECVIGDGGAAATVLERVSETLDPFRRSRAYYEFLSVFRARHPARQWLLVAPALTMLSTVDAHRSVQLDVLELLGDVADEHPSQVRAAIVSEYGSEEDFLSATAGDIIARRELAERVFDVESET